MDKYLLKCIKPFNEHIFGPNLLLALIRPPIIDFCKNYNGSQDISQIFKHGKHVYVILKRLIELHPNNSNNNNININDNNNNDNDSINNNDNNNNSNNIIPLAMVKLLNALGIRAENIFKQYQRNRNMQPDIDSVKPTAEQIDRWNEYTVSGCLAPELKRLSLQYITSNQPLEKRTCQKNFDHKASMTDCLYVTRCLFHGGCISFSVCSEPESQLTLLDTIITTMDECPDIIACDFVCRFAVSALMREPDFFKNAIMLGDEPHQGTHKCSDCHSCRLEKRMDNLLKNINDIWTEHCNHLTNRVKECGYWMQLKTFMMILRIVILIQNRKQFLKLDKQ